MLQGEREGLLACTISGKIKGRQNNEYKYCSLLRRIYIFSYYYIQCACISVDFFILWKSHYLLGWIFGWIFG